MFVYRKVLGIKMGKFCIVWAGNRINDASKITLGDHVIIGTNNVFLVRGGIQIGSNVNISGFSYFISQEHDVNDPWGHTKLSPIKIEDHEWVATNCTIMPGVTLGEGCVVAAGAVVVKDVPPYTVVGGNPAKPIKNRLKDIRYRLSDIRGIKWL